MAGNGEACPPPVVGRMRDRVVSALLVAMGGRGVVACSERVLTRSRVVPVHACVCVCVCVCVFVCV
jgi:hypothetical protein